MKYTLLLLTFFLFAPLVHAQDQQAKAYFFTAVDQYNNGNYIQALAYCQKAQETIGETNARIEAIRVKSYYAADDLANAKASLEIFLNLKADEQLLKDIAPYIAKIEAAENELKLQQELAAKKAAEKAEYDRTHITCSLCNGEGHYEDEKDCAYCSYGKTDCKVRCDNCKGKGKFSHGTAVGYSNCWQCDGTGKKTTKCTCNYCDGRGYDMVTKTCIQCNGKGDVSISGN